MTAPLTRVRRLTWLVRTLVRAGFLALLRPDRYLRMAAVIRRQGTTPMSGIGLSAARAPRRTALVDELGSLTWAQLDARCDALAAGLADLRPAGSSGTVGILCRNHRGLVESLAACARVGADALLLNTGFSAPQLTEVLDREDADVLVYDEEFAGLVEQARSKLDLVELVAWHDTPLSGHSPAQRSHHPPAPQSGGVTTQLLGSDHSTSGAGRRGAGTVEEVIRKHRGERASKPERPGRIVLLTSGTTGTPKGARRSSGGGAGALAAMFDRIPWRAEQTTVVAAPMFHAWGFGQLAISATMACTVVMRRKFDPEATLRMVEEHHATGLAVVPVMLERIMTLPADVLDAYDLSSLRFVTASGSRMRPDAVTSFMDRFGDVVYNSYNATEAGLISTATPADLRAAADTAGRPVVGTEVRILDDDLKPVRQGDVGKIAVLSGSEFEGYTSGDSKDFHESYMISGDLGRLDDAGRLYVVGRDDEMIVSGGENVYPTEVEETLNGHPAVSEAAVVGVDDDQYGQRLAAFVVLSDGQDASADDLKKHVKEQLAGYKVPRDLTFLDELPRNATGKVVKRELPTS